MAKSCDEKKAQTIVLDLVSVLIRSLLVCKSEFVRVIPSFASFSLLFSLITKPHFLGYGAITT